MATLEFGTLPCGCPHDDHAPKFIVLTGGPGAGKTAVLEMARRSLCKHVALLPEAASIVFGGGFPRHDTAPGRRASQRAIFHVQRQIETLVVEERRAGVALCDRGTIDGLAYWPGTPESYWLETGTRAEDELARYAAVIHLRTPSPRQGYNHSNKLRLESASEAARIDERILEAWRAHPRRFVVDNTDRFEDKAAAALNLLKTELPACCRTH